MSNYINDIEITNFKSIRHQKIDGCKRINVFIGYPNVGKSNILEAVGCAGVFHRKRENRISISEFIRFNMYGDIFYDGSIQKPADILFNSSLLTRLRYTQETEELVLTLSKVNRLRRYENGKSEVESLSKLFEIIFGEGAVESKEGFNQGDNSERRRREYIFSIKPYIFKPLTSIGVARGASLSVPSGENLIGILSQHSDFRKEVNDLFESYGLRIAIDKNSIQLKILKENVADGTIFLLPYNLIADTLQRLIFYKAAIRTNENTILLFEEPEAHMFPPYIRKFTSDVIFDKTNQFFIATHSPYVLDEFIEEVPDELSVYLVDYQNGETIIKRMEEEQLKEIRNYGVDLFFNLESYLKNG